MPPLVAKFLLDSSTVKDCNNVDSTNVEPSILLTDAPIWQLRRLTQYANVLLVDYQYYTLKTVEKWQNRFCVDTKNVRFNVFNFWLHQNHIDMDWMGAFEPTP